MGLIGLFKPNLHQIILKGNKPRKDTFPFRIIALHNNVIYQRTIFLSFLDHNIDIEIKLIICAIDSNCSVFFLVKSVHF